MKEYIFPLILFVLMPYCQVSAEVKDPAMRAFEEKALVVQPFNLSSVRLLDGPFKHAQDLCSQSLLKLEPDRLLSKFRTTAGLAPKAQPFYSMHDKRYTIYWDIFTDQQWFEKKNDYERIKKNRRSYRPEQLISFNPASSNRRLIRICYLRIHLRAEDVKVPEADVPTKVDGFLMI